MRQMVMLCSHWANVSECLSDSIVSGACRTILVGVAAALFPRRTPAHLSLPATPSSNKSRLCKRYQICRRGHQFWCSGAGSPGPCPSSLKMATGTGANDLMRFAMIVSNPRPPRIKSSAM